MPVPAVPLRWMMILVCLVGLACGGDPSREPTREAPGEGGWAIAIHGGAGFVARDLGEERQAELTRGIATALGLGRDRLEAGDSALDVVEAVIRLLEEDPQFNAGRGAVFNHLGGHELDASVMDGKTLACGGVAGVRTVRHPISLARAVMERTPHVLLAAEGAERFADEVGVERVDPSYFSTERRRESLRRAQEKERQVDEHGTVGVVAMDRAGNLAAGTSTGGLTNKRFGRIGDSPIVGAGTYADNTTCAVSGTGKGEEFIRHGVARGVADLIVYRDLGLQEAVDEIIELRLQPGEGGVIAVDRLGRIAFGFNTQAMPRGAADSTGRFETLVWE